MKKMYESESRRPWRGAVRSQSGRNGFSLLEIMFGIGLFAVVSLSFIQYLQNAVKESRFSGEHLTALILSQKVIEDISEEMALNPYGYETLGIDRSSAGMQEVVEGKSVFFSFLEDRAAPWGQIDPLQDGVIAPAMTPLYDTAKPFRFRVFGDRLQKSGDGGNRNILTCDLNFEWKSKAGSGKFTNSCLYFSPVTEKKADLAWAVDEAKIDARIPAEVYRAPTRSLLEIAQAAGESLEAVTALGRISLVTQDFTKSTDYKLALKEVETLNTRLGNLPAGAFDDRFACRIAICECWYNLARMNFQVTAYLEPSLTKLVQGKSFKDIGRTSIDPIALQKALLNYRIIYGTFVGSLVQSRSLYESLARDPVTTYEGGKKQLQVLQKLLDLYRVSALLPERPNGMNELKTFLKDLDGFSSGRNPFLNRLVKQEFVFLGNRTEWMNRYPNLKRLDLILNGRLPPIFVFIDRVSRDAVTNWAANP